MAGSLLAQEPTYRSSNDYNTEFSSFADDGESVADTIIKLEEEFEKTAEALKESAETIEGLEEDIEGIEEDIESNSESIDDIDDVLSYKVDAGGKDISMKLSGRIHADYWGFPQADAGINALEGGPSGPQDRIGFRRMRFGVSGKAPGNMRYKIEMEFAGGNQSEFRDAYLGWYDLPFLQTVLVGNQKRPYGSDHLNSSRYNIFLERPFVIESFNQDARRFGIQSYGVSEDEAWNWRYGVFNQRLIQDEGNYTNDHLQLEVAGRLANTWWYDECSDGRGYGHWAIAGSWAFPDGSTPADNGGVGPDANEARFRHRPEARSATRWLDTGRIAGANDYQLIAFEKVLNFGSLQLTGEYQNIFLQRDLGAGADLHFHGGYVQAGYFLTGEHMPWDRRSGTLGRIKPFENFFLVDCCNGSVGRGTGAWQIAARYSVADFVSEDIAGGEGESLTLGLNWYWTPYARMQFNYIFGRIDNNAVTRGVPLQGNYQIAGTRFMIDF